MANSQDQGTFDYWITNRIFFHLARPKSGDTGDFEKWITDRLTWDEYAETAAGVVTGVAALSGTGATTAIITVYIAGQTVWGHDTGVIETNVRDFDGNWSGTGSIENAGDAERIALDSGENMLSEIIYTGANLVQLLQNNYQSGDDVTLEYRHGSTVAVCEAAGWSSYTVPFSSSGFVQIRLTSTL